MIGQVGVGAVLHVSVLDFDGTPVTGLVGTDFEVLVVANGVVSGVVPTITDVGSGVYSVTLTPDVGGTWSIYIHVVPTEDRYEEMFQVELPVVASLLDARGLTALRVGLIDQLDTGNPLSVGSASVLAKKVAVNRMEVTGFPGGPVVLSLYDDDGVTVLLQWDLATDGGELVATVRGAQTRRSAPV